MFTLSNPTMEEALRDVPLFREFAGTRDSEMHQSKKGNPRFFGMKARIGVDADSGLAHTVRGTAGNVNDVVEANSLLHGPKSDVFADADCQGQAKGLTQKRVNWHIAMRPGARRVMDKRDAIDALIDQAEKPKASVRAKGRTSVSRDEAPVWPCDGALPGLEKTTGQLVTLFAPSNLWMVRCNSLASQALLGRTACKGQGSTR